MSDASFKTGVELREERLWALFLILLDLAFFVAVVAALAAQWMAWRMGFPEVLDGDLLPLHQLPLKPRVLHLVGLLMAAAAWPAFMVKKLGLRWASWHLFWMGLVAVLVARLGFMYDPRAVMRWMEVLSASEDWLWLAEEVRIGFGSLVAVGLMFRIWLAFERMKGLEGVGDHGSARYGTVKEHRKVGLTTKPKERTIFVGEIEGQQWFSGGPQHEGIVAPTGAGKTQGAMAPTLLTATGGAFVFDPKGGELYRLTAPWRKEGMGHKIYRFDVRDEARVGDKNRINPYNMVRPWPEDVGDMQRLGRIFVPPLKEGSENQIWQDWARQFFVMLSLHVLYTEEEKTLGRAVELFGQYEFRDLLKLMRYSLHDPSGTLGWKVDGGDSSTHPYIRATATQMLGMPARTTGSIQGNVSTVLESFKDAVLLDAFSGTDLDLDAVYQGRATLYFTSDPSDIGRVRSIAHMLISYLVQRQTELVDKRGGKVGDSGCLLVLDEFFSLGKYPGMEDLLAIIRSAGIRVVYAIQNRKQVINRYGRDETVLATTPSFRVMSGTEDVDTAKMFSARMGKRTIRVESYNSSWKSGRSVGGRNAARDLMAPDEIMGMPDDEGLFMPTGARPIKFKTVFAYQDPVLRQRMNHKIEGPIVDFCPGPRPGRRPEAWQQDWKKRVDCTGRSSARTSRVGDGRVGSAC